MTWTVGGDTRQAIMYAPSAAAGANGAPLVMSFDGHGDNMQNFQHTDLHRCRPQYPCTTIRGRSRRLLHQVIFMVWPPRIGVAITRSCSARR
jgi:hypothetical protein